jgi:serine/threonine protein kinase
MTSKRPRTTDDHSQSQSASSTDDVDERMISTITLSPFGQDDIQELAQGNPAFARGAFGELSIGIRRTDEMYSRSINNGNPYVAIKKLENALASTASRKFGYSAAASTKPQLSREVFNEILALRHLDPHPNIIKLLAVYIPPRHSEFDSTRSLALAFPYVPMDLYQVLEWRKRQQSLPPLSFSMVRTMAHDILQAVAHCHAHGVLHRDVKPGNLLVTHHGSIQLCDFGLAKPFLDRQARGDGELLPIPVSGASGTKGLCTLFYRPPEILFGASACHPSVDLYSSGLVVAELLVGTPLWQGSNVLGQLSVVFDALGTPDEAAWPTVKELPDYMPFATKEAKPWTDILPQAAECPPLLELVSRLVVLNPHDRMTAQEAVEHLESVDSRLLPRVSRIKMQEELIQPSSLQIPSLEDHADTTTLSEVALKLAKERRTFLSDKPEGPTKTLEELLAEFSQKDLQTLVEEQQAADIS